MRQPGVEVRPLKQITGRAEFAEVFMTQARVEKSDLIGRLGQGWEIAQTTLATSVAAIPWPGYSLRHGLRQLWRGPTLRRNGQPLLDEPSVRARLGRMYAELEVQRYAALRVLSALEKATARGRRPPSPSSPTASSRSASTSSSAGDPRALRPGDGGAARGPHVPRGRLVRSRRHAGLRVSVVPGGHDLLRLVRDPEERHRRARAGPAQGAAGRPGEGLMDFAFDSDQQLLKDSARAFLDAHCPSSVVRALWDDPEVSEAMWKDMAQLGWLGLSLPEAVGGSALGMVETAIVLEETGRAACPSPYFPTVLAATRWPRGQAEQQRRWLPAIAAGAARATVAFLDTDSAGTRAAFLRERPERRAVGRSTAPSASCPGPTWPTSSSSPRRRRTASALFLVDPAAPGLTVSAVQGIDLHALVDAHPRWRGRRRRRRAGCPRPRWAAARHAAAAGGWARRPRCVAPRGGVWT